MEIVEHRSFREQARNDAIRWLEQRGVIFGHQRSIEIGRLGPMHGAEVGVSGTSGPYWRLRLDYDPIKGPHYNAEYAKGASRQKAAFCFPGPPELMVRLALGQRPR